MTAEQQRRKARRDLADRFAAEVSTWPSTKLRASLAQPEQVRAAEERERQDRELPRRCETCAYWRRLPLRHDLGVCRFEIPLPTWAAKVLRDSGANYTDAQDFPACPTWAPALPPSPAT